MSAPVIQYGTPEHWERVAGTRSAAASEVSLALIDSMLEGVPLGGRRLLDVGTGNGNLPIAAARAGAEAVGIDVTEAGIALATGNADASVGDPAVRARLAFHLMDATRLALPDASFDVATVLKTIWCLPDIAAGVRELGRVLGPSGRLVVQLWGDPARCSLLTLGAGLVARSLPGMQVPPGYKSAFEVTPELLRPLCEAAGLPRFDLARRRFAIAVQSADVYWTLLRSIAGTTYYALTLLPPERRQRIDERLTAEAHGPGGIPLELEWLVFTASR